LGLEKRLYDTGKVLNLLLLAQGEHLSFMESSSLQHLGSISFYAIYKNRLLFKRILMKFRRIKLQVRLKFGQLTVKSAGQNMMLPESAGFQAMQRRKRAICCYFTQVLQSLFENRSLPLTPDMDDREIARRIEWVTRNIVFLYEEFKDRG
jgi:hypothetical protein